jgi:hypothetical protein
VACGLVFAAFDVRFWEPNEQPTLEQLASPSLPRRAIEAAYGDEPHVPFHELVRGEQRKVLRAVQSESVVPGRMHQGIVGVGGAGDRDAEGLDERGEFGLDGVRVGVFGGKALRFDETADSFEVVDAQ